MRREMAKVIDRHCVIPGKSELPSIILLVLLYLAILVRIGRASLEVFEPWNPCVVVVFAGDLMIRADVIDPFA